MSTSTLTDALRPVNLALSCCTCGDPDCRPCADAAAEEAGIALEILLTQLPDEDPDLVADADRAWLAGQYPDAQGLSKRDLDLAERDYYEATVSAEDHRLERAAAEAAWLDPYSYA